MQSDPSEVDDDGLDPIERLTVKTVTLTDTIKQERDARRRGNRQIVALIVLVIVGVLWIRDITQDTNTAVNKTIPNLQAENADLKTVVDQAVVVITQQLVPQIVALGGEPPLIELNPDKVEAGETSEAVPFEDGG